MKEGNNEINIEEKNISNNAFIKINKKNNFEIIFNKDFSCLKTKIQNKFQSELDSAQDIKLIHEYLNIIFTNNDFDPFATSLHISKIIMNNKGKQIKKDINKNFEYLFKNIKEIKPNFTILIIKIYKIIGIILSYVYSQLNINEINTKNKLLEEINNIKDKNNIYDEFMNNIKNCKKNDYANTIKTFIIKNKDKYKIPCELILLMNFFKNIYTLEIDFENLILNETDFYLFSISLINIDILFPKINYAKLNIINSEFLSDIYSRFFRLEKEKLDYSNKYIKFFNFIDEKIFFGKEKYFNREFHWNDVSVLEDINDNNTNNSVNNKINFQFDLMNEKININDIIEKYKNILSAIIVTFFSLPRLLNINKMDLIINDNYTNEFKYLFKKFCFLNPSNTFNIINFIPMKEDIRSLNLDFNILDNNTTNKLLELIYINKLLSELQLSFFTSEPSYSHSAIYKLYNQQKESNKKEYTLNFKEDLEKSYLNKMINHLERNLNLLFDAIAYKKFLVKLILYIDIPLNIINNQLYMILILKFIMNVLFLIDDENNGFYNLTIFSPNTVFDKDFFPCIEDYLNEFETSQKNNNLIELNLQLKFYKIINIKKLVSTNLIILNIGDFDIISLESFINYITSYKFSFNSNLKSISLGLVKSIFEYDSKIKYIFIKLFSIKIQSLIQLNLISNIIIKTKEDYFDLISKLKYNWISCSNIILNKESNNIIQINKVYKNKVNYISPNLDEDIISNNSKYNKMIICYWYLRSIFLKKIKEYKKIDDIQNKNIDIPNKICYGIFRYLNNERNMNITHGFNI